jgi:hypothetical protein
MLVAGELLDMDLIVFRGPNAFFVSCNNSTLFSVPISAGFLMDLIDQLKILSTKILRQKDGILTEEATKNAFIMPFIAALGYDVFDPLEVVPEYIADQGIKKGEKVDYAIMQNGQPIMFFECKSCNSALGDSHASQLFRYFSSHTSLRIGILTNGISYHFYSDLENSNVMDSKPFLEFDMLDIHDAQVGELKKLTKASFNVEEILSAASELKHAKEIRRVLEQQLDDPTDDFVKYILSAAYSGRQTQKIVSQFKDITKKAFNQFVNEKINERLKSAMTNDPGVRQNVTESTSPQHGGAEEQDGVVTTVEEIEGYMIVKSIVREVISPERVVMRDGVAYCSILIDDNNRKLLCRLYFNSNKKKYVGILDENKVETKVPVTSLDDIFSLADNLKAVARRFPAETGVDKMKA